MHEALRHHARSRLAGALLLGGCALTACSGDDKAAVGQSNLGSDAGSDATTGEEGPDVPETDATSSAQDSTRPVEADVDALADATIPDAPSPEAAPETDSAFDSSDEGHEGSDGGHAGPDAGDAGATGDAGSDGGVAGDGGRDGGVALDAGDGGVEGGAGDGGLSLTAKIIFDTQGAACEACAAQKCLGPTATCESLTGEAAGGPMAGTSKSSLCARTLSCTLDPTPATPCYDVGTAPESCYCGNETVTACQTTGPTASAQCATQEQDGLETQDPATALARFNTTSYASGMANTVFACLSTMCFNDCLP